MTFVLLSTFGIGIGVAYIQGRMDPEGHTEIWTVFDTMSREVVFSTFLGANIGSFSAVIVIAIRSKETDNI